MHGRVSRWSKEIRDLYKHYQDIVYELWRRPTLYNRLQITISNVHIRGFKNKNFNFGFELVFTPECLHPNRCELKRNLITVRMDGVVFTRVDHLWWRISRSQLEGIISFSHGIIHLSSAMDYQNYGFCFHRGLMTCDPKYQDHSQRDSVVFIGYWSLVIRNIKITVWGIVLFSERMMMSDPEYKDHILKKWLWFLIPYETSFLTSCQQQ